MTEALGLPSDDSFDYAERVVHEIVTDSFIRPGMEASTDEVKRRINSEAVLEQLLSNVRLVGDPTDN